MLLYMQEKGVLGALIAVFSYLYSCVSEMIIVLAILMIFDWITGCMVAKKEGRYDHESGTWGAVKKLFYIVIIVTGYLADITITVFAHKAGLDFNTYGALGFAVTFYLIGNEGVSVYTNALRLGLPVPRFLINVFNNFKVLAKTSVKQNQLTKGDVKDGDIERNEDKD